MDLRPGQPLAKNDIVDLLCEARERTQLLIDPLELEDLAAQHSPLMSPILWDLGHIAHFEEVWLLDNLEGRATESEGLSGMYNPFENPRALRGDLDLPPPAHSREYLADVRKRVLERLRAVDLLLDDPLLRDSFVFRMVLQHEYQHNETILQTLQLKKGDRYPAPRVNHRRDSVPADQVEKRMVRCPGGEIQIGTNDRSEAYDNERPLHTVSVEPFWIDATPVTNGQYLEFMAEEGYERRELWSVDGWSWRVETGASAPGHWAEDGGRWRTRVMDLEREVDPKRPVCHVSFHEAEAFCRWAGKRLPSETEWEAACSWDPDAGRKLRFPWGNQPASSARANIDALSFDTAPVGAYPANVSPIGCYGMIGDVWEWTSSDFGGYPGFEPFPYKEYSEVFFGSDYRILRGGSWATRSGAVRATFRNWDFPIRRQIFSGFRCARDAS